MKTVSNSSVFLLTALFLLSFETAFSQPVPDYTESQNWSEAVVLTSTDDVSEVDTNGSVLYRINAGGASLNVDGTDWIGGTAAAVYSDSRRTWSTNNAVTRGDVSTHVPLSLFSSEIWSNSTNSWKFPVAPGRYEVKLYFAEIWPGAMKPGSRVFDVEVEGVSLKNLDVFAEVGGNTALEKIFTVTSDDLLDIKLVKIVQNPAIKAIEIIATDVESFVASGDEVTQTLDDEVVVENSAEIDEDNSSLSEESNLQDIHDGTAVQVADIEENETGVTEQNTVLYRINAGGVSLSDGWVSDQSQPDFNSGNRWSVNKTVNRGNVPANVPLALFSSERWSESSLSWWIPVEPGDYEVKLYFAEIWSGAMMRGGRVFNVDVEGMRVNNLDVFAEAGGDTALVKTFPVNSDGILNITLEKVIQNPAIKGIEIISVDHLVSADGSQAIETNQQSNSESLSEPANAVYLHYDVAPDPDDIHAIVAGKQLADAVDLTPSVVIGTHGYMRGRGYLTADAIKIADEVYGIGQYTEVGNNHAAHYDLVAAEWDSVIAAGGIVYVAEGGPSDFTFGVLNAMFEDKKQVVVVQHSKWNEDNTSDLHLEYVKHHTTYVRIQDGNFKNATAKLKLNMNESSEDLLIRSNPSWELALNLYDRVIDFSDTVELLHILDIPLSDVSDMNSFINYISGDRAIDTTIESIAESEIGVVEHESAVQVVEIPVVEVQETLLPSPVILESQGLGYCEVIENTLRAAKISYAAACTLPLKDCDPVSGGYWKCSSRNL